VKQTPTKEEMQIYIHCLEIKARYGPGFISMDIRTADVDNHHEVGQSIAWNMVDWLLKSLECLVCC
jgi:hypothetical protein